MGPRGRRQQRSLGGDAPEEPPARPWPAAPRVMDPHPLCLEDVPPFLGCTRRLGGVCRVQAPLPKLTWSAPRRDSGHCPLFLPWAPGRLNGAGYGH